MALQIEDLDTHDRAGTYINRGVIELRRDLFEPAREDFNQAIAIAPAIRGGFGQPRRGHGRRKTL